VENGSQSVTISKRLAFTDILAEVSKLEVFDVDGKKVCFGSLYQSQKTIVVFIRHFFCGACQQYTVALASISQEALEQADTNIIIIGCGEWQPIRHYLETTGFHGQIYADPTRKLYHTLGMITNLDITPQGVPRKSYLQYSVFVNALRSTWMGPVKNPLLIGKQGHLSQLGGDFILGPGNQCSYASRMQHTEDHAEVADLLQAAGVASP